MTTPLIPKLKYPKTARSFIPVITNPQQLQRTYELLLRDAERVGQAIDKAASPQIKDIEEKLSAVRAELLEAHGITYAYSNPTPPK